MTWNRWALLLAIIAAAILLMSGPGSQMGWWDFRQGFQLMRWSVYLAGGTAVLSIILLVIKSQRQGHVISLLSALVIALLTTYIPVSWLLQAREVPRIHDITTDTERVPEFVEIAPLRAEAPNPVAYPGEEVAAMQREAYPEIKTYVTTAPADIVFATALSIVEDRGWMVVATDATQGRIEATEVTYWFGFEDDVVIRIKSDGGETYVDIRSKSRVGLSDVGTNARRIRSLISELDRRLAP